MTGGNPAACEALRLMLGTRAVHCEEFYELA